MVSTLRRGEDPDEGPEASSCTQVCGEGANFQGQSGEGAPVSDQAVRGAWNSTSALEVGNCGLLKTIL